ncbi:unnamed protein product [Calicophoron daubneyi]|uniref:Uncharacterized protein n=1 Tax=Calicophoron daubneyi TaxID=300641 RepID=A0AAV2T4N7_CALDB
MRVNKSYHGLPGEEFVTIETAHAGPHQKRLLGYVFNQSRWDAHNPLERPTTIEGKPVKVYLKVFLNQIMDMDEKNQVLSTILWLDMRWSDYHFKWDMQEYSNIKFLNVPPERVWRPDLILYNSASDKFDQIFPTRVIISNTGHIQWMPPGLFHSTCTIEVNYFPFDYQQCSLKFGTWSHQGDKIDLKLQCDNETDDEQECSIQNDVDLSAYLANSEWALESATVKRNVETYGGDDQKYIDLTIDVHMQRRALWYMFNIVVPCMIMSVLGLLVFTLPPEANQKIVLGVTTLLSLVALLQLVSDKLPQTSAGNSVLGEFHPFSSLTNTVKNGLSLALILQCTFIISSGIPAKFTLNYERLVQTESTLDSNYRDHRIPEANTLKLPHRPGEFHTTEEIETFVNKWLASLLHVKRKEIDDREESIRRKPPHFASSSKPPRSSFSSASDYTGRNGPKPPKQQSTGLISPDEAGWDQKSSRWSNVIDFDSEFRPNVLINTHQENGGIGQRATNQFELRGFGRVNSNFGQTPKKSQQMSTPVSQKPGYVSGTVKEADGQDPMTNTRSIGSKPRGLTNHIMSSTRDHSPRPYIGRSENIIRFSASVDSNAKSPPPTSPENPSPRPPPPPPVLSADEELDRQLKEFCEKALIIRKLKFLTKEIRYVTGRMHRGDQEQRTSKEWRFASCVLDRLFLYIFMALNLFISVGILTSAPTIIKAFTTTGAPSQPM